MATLSYYIYIACLVLLVLLNEPQRAAATFTETNIGQMSHWWVGVGVGGGGGYGDVAVVRRPDMFVKLYMICLYVCLFGSNNKMTVIMVHLQNQ